MLRNKLTLQFIILLLPFIIKAQTCIVVVVREDTITIGADSRVSKTVSAYNNGRKIDTLVYDYSECKINSTGKIFYTGAGIQMDMIAEYAKDISVKQGNQISIVYPIDSVVKKLENNIEPIRIQNPARFLQKYKGDFAVLLFYFFNKDVPTQYSLIFGTTNNINEKTAVRVRQQYSLLKDPENGQMKIFRLGHYNAIGESVSSVVFKKFGITNGVKELLKIQIAATPSDVGYPISLVELTPKKANWIETGLCHLPTKKSQ